jgi:hypothetical protein
MSLTYVTAFMKIYDADPDEMVNGKNLAIRMEYVKPLLHCKIPLIVFISQCFLEPVKAACSSNPNIQFRVMELEETETYGLLKPFETKIPIHRNKEKDTFEFMVLMNAKAEFLHKIAEENPFQTDQFAWVDFCIFHVLHNAPISQKRLEMLCNAKLKEDHPLVIPGCWSARSKAPQDAIHWRFCGGFYMGTKKGCQEFFAYHRKYLPTAYDGVTWEVNYWATIEVKEPTFSVRWYKADHNDSILDIPAEFFEVIPENPVKWLTHSATRVGTYPYPSLESYVPTSSSFLEFQGQQLLNVRYVNYVQTPEGLYIIHDPNSYLKTENFMMRLKGYEESISVAPMHVDTSLERTRESIQGLEDIRLYEANGHLKFIATQCEWSPSKQSRMVIGSVDLETHAFHNLQILEPPQPTGCEKNWIPIGSKFIYQWHPFQIGEVREGRLEIVQTYPTNRVFQKVRGSTLFFETEEGLLGVVHYSEERKPRHYYHMLVLLHKETLQPMSISSPFVFGRQGIEFCIGFAIRGSEYQFWYSQHDRDPVWLVIPRTEIPMRLVSI